MKKVSSFYHRPKSRASVKSNVFIVLIAVTASVASSWIFLTYFPNRDSGRNHQEFFSGPQNDGQGGSGEGANLSDAGSSDAQTDRFANNQNREGEVVKELNAALINISEKVKQSVVTVFTEKTFKVRRMSSFGSPFFNDPFFENFFRGFRQPRQGQPDGDNFEERKQQGMGSGVIVSADGYILTNNHVVAETSEIRVRTLDNKTFTATVVGADPKTDIAVIKIDAKGLVPIDQGDSNKLRVGEIVLAVGSPMSANLAHTVTQGIVSAVGRSNVGLADYEDFIQTDADINPGNSGGALVNLSGELVGVNTAIMTRSGGSQGLGFSVPVNMARSVMESLIKNGEVIRSWLGVQIQDITEDLQKAMNLKSNEGVLVAGVESGSPADRAGFQAGDVILKLGSEPVKSGVELRNRVSVSKPGTEIKVEILRDSKKMLLNTKLERMPSEQKDVPEPDRKEVEKASELFGFEVSSLSRDLAAKYRLNADPKTVVITAIDQSSSAFAAGVREGDIIQSINRKEIDGLQSFQEVSKDLKPGSTVLLRIIRGNGRLFVAFPLDE